MYDCDDIVTFNNEVEKLNLLGQIMEELGDQSFIVKVLDSFQCEIGPKRGTYCIIMEHLDLSLAEYINNLPQNQSDTQGNVITLEYSMTDEESQVGHSPRTSQKQKNSAIPPCMQRSGQNGLGLSLELVKIVGFQIAAVLRLFNMKGLSLVHGAVRAENIFFSKKNVPEFKLLDFSCAFFLDELPPNLAGLRNGD